MQNILREGMPDVLNRDGWPAKRKKIREGLEKYETGGKEKLQAFGTEAQRDFTDILGKFSTDITPVKGRTNSSLAEKTMSISSPATRWYFSGWFQ